MPKDMIDPRAIRVVEGPNINEYPATAQITEVRFTPGDFFVRHTKEGKGPSSWPGSKIPGWGNGTDDPGTIQWTLWVAVKRGSEWLTAGCLEFWPEDVPKRGAHTGDSPAPFSTARQNWYYSAPGGMSEIQPQAGDEIGLCASQGSQRKKDINTVRERSNWVRVIVPAHNDGGTRFAVEDQQPAPVQPGPSPVPPEQPSQPAPPTDEIRAALADALNRIGQLEAGQRRRLIRATGTAGSGWTRQNVVVDKFEYES